MNRDFKGVWIPKEIWLHKELSALDRMIYAEIDSLDNENHCTASNEYFAEFCGVSERTVIRTIQKLEELGFVKTESFDGRHRIIKVSEQTRQNVSAEVTKCQSINISNNLEIKELNNTKVLFTKPDESTDIQSNKPKRKNLFDKLTDSIQEYTNDNLLRNALYGYRDMLLEMSKDSGRPLYLNVFKGKLNSLSTLATDANTQLAMVQQSLSRGWVNFYAVQNSATRYKDPMNENGVVNSVKADITQDTGEVF